MLKLKPAGLGIIGYKVVKNGVDPGRPRDMSWKPAKHSFTGITDNSSVIFISI
jgi:hypothetical protein